MSATNETSLKESIIKETKEVMSMSSLHGVPHLITTKNFTLKLLWTFCIIMSVTMGNGWYLIQSISNYLTHEIVTNTQISNVFQLPFPVVSICNFNYDDIESNPIEKSITNCGFNSLPCDFENDFELYKDPYYGKCNKYLI